jgi:hypothetical protein
MLCKEDIWFTMHVCRLSWHKQNHQKKSLFLTINSEASQTIWLAKIFTKIDLGGAYNFICIKQSNEWKPTFNTRCGHFN